MTEIESSIEEFFNDYINFPKLECAQTYSKKLLIPFYENSFEKKEILKSIQSQDFNEFQSKFWEAKIFNLFSKSGYTINCLKESLDFQANINSFDFYIEATCPRQSEIIEKFYDNILNIRAQSVPREEFSKRLTSAISTKIEQYQKHKKNDDNGFVLAINGSSIGQRIDTEIGLSNKIPRILEVLFGYGNMTITFDKNTNKIVDKSIQSLKHLKSNSGANILNHWFLTPRSKDIIGILYSSSNPFHDCLGEPSDIIFIHNPMNNTDLNLDGLNFDKEYKLQENGYLIDLISKEELG